MMKNNLARRKLQYFFTRRIHGKYAHTGLGLAISRLKRTKLENENILRWEDDGGQISRQGNSVKRSDHPVAPQANKIAPTHFDAFHEELEKRAYQVYKDEYFDNDSLGG
jgi:hypothetical protein